MKNETYKILKEKITELNNINDKINFVKWNAEEGPKFETVEEMKEFEKQVLNGEFDFLVGADNIDNETDLILQSFKHPINNYNFYIYTYKKNNDYITYMSIECLDNNDIIDKIYGYKTSSEEESNSYFEKLKTDIISNELDYIFENILIDVDNNIKNLKMKYEELTNAN